MARILVAEDDSSMRHFLNVALRRAGHEVQTANDGLHALEKLKTENCKYDLLLADIVMPGMDGIELSQKASTLCPKLKVMFITGFSAMALHNRMPDKSHARLLSKPFHLNELVRQVDAILTA